MIEAIIKTICYFDLLDYPLTAVEVWRWLYVSPSAHQQRYSLTAVAEALEIDEKLHRTLSRREGFYCLRGREKIIPQRKIRNSAVDKQMKIAVFWTKVFRLIPWVEMVAVASSLPLGNVKETSDIDFFIICQKGHVWVTRFFLVGLLKLSHQRPGPKRTKNKICLSYYVTDQALSLQSAQLGHEDVVFAHYVAGFLPLYDQGGVYQRWYQDNSWYRESLPHMAEQATVLQLGVPSWLRLWHRVARVIMILLYNSLTKDWYTAVQLRILPDRLKTLANIDSRVIITEDVLKFHDKDNRLQLKSQWHNKIKTHIYA